MSNARNENLKNSIYAILIGEGGLLSDFAPEQLDKSINADMIQVYEKITTDANYWNQLAEMLIARYNKICSLRGLDSKTSLSKVYDSYQCSLWAHYYGMQLLAQEQENKNNLER